MTIWAHDELSKIGAAEEARIASVRREGSLTQPVIVWIVRLGEDLYV
jgi:hypothetical protein